MVRKAWCSWTLVMTSAALLHGACVGPEGSWTGAGDGDNLDELPETEPDTTVISNVLATTSVATTFTDPMVGPGALLPDWGDFTALAADGDCIETSLGTGLSASISFNDCRSSVNKLAFSGSVTITLRLAPPHLFIDVDSLEFAGRQIRGWIAIIAADSIASVFQIEAMLTSAEGGTLSQLALYGTNFELTRYGFILAGDARLEMASQSLDLAFQDVGWVLGNCMPSTGQIRYSDSTSTETAQFFSATAAAGHVALVREGERLDVLVRSLCWPDS